jgi:tRNA(Glu) U13 pseudouridine synthase TruD
MLLCNCHPEAPVSLKMRKQKMAANWGNWNVLKSIAVEKSEIKICDSLLKDSSVSGLLKILRDVPKEEFAMHLSAYQSFIWNEVCRESISDNPEIKEIPTIAPDILPTSENVLNTIHSVLAKRGVRASKLKLAEFKECGYFSSFMRAVKVYPEIFETSKCEDELFESRLKLTAKFLLPSGSYATMLLKQI